MEVLKKDLLNAIKAIKKTKDNQSKAIFEESYMELRSSNAIIRMPLPSKVQIPFCISLRELDGFVKYCNAKEKITIEYNDGFVRLKQGIKFEDFHSSPYNKQNYDLKHTAIIDKHSLLVGMKLVTPFVGIDNPQPRINTLCMEFSEDGIKLISTNTRVLSVFDLSSEKQQNISYMLKDFSVLAQALKQSKCDKVKVEFYFGIALFYVDHLVIGLCLELGDYIRYRSIIRKHHTHIIANATNQWRDILTQCKKVDGAIILDYKGGALNISFQEAYDGEVVPLGQISTDHQIDFKTRIDRKRIETIMNALEEDTFNFAFEDEEASIQIETNKLLFATLPA